MNTPHNALKIADTLVRYGINRDQTCDPLQIIKMTYFCHGWMLGLYDREMFSQPVLAWKYGPVIQNVYDEVKRYGRRPINHPLLRFEYEEFDEQESDLIEQVFNVYRPFGGIELSMMTHAKDTPWYQVWNIDRNRDKDTIISNELIKDYFVKQYEKDNGNTQ